MSDSAVLWYLNRATGTVLLVVFTLVLVLGIVATVGDARPGASRAVPRFLTQEFHRHLSLLAVGLLAAHVITAVLDTFVDIRWWQALLPFTGSYRPLWLGFGTLALDITVLVVLTSLARTRLGHRAWRGVHLLAYAAWAVAVTHGVGIGTDSRQTWSLALTVVCVAMVVVAILARSVAIEVPRRMVRSR